ncbi:MAG: hypothetical protein D3910_22400 [Candidatus Electrothrix sp. ATG2]|nr:hypothetical protein [Candidatus Electrothrix sp. ATG2]
MNASNEAWEYLGELAEEDAMHVLTRLYSMYEEQGQRNPGDKAAALFFRNLIRALGQTSGCNLNRR